MTHFSFSLNSLVQGDLLVVFLPFVWFINEQFLIFSFIFHSIFTWFVTCWMIWKQFIYDMQYTPIMICNTLQIYRVYVQYVRYIIFAFSSFLQWSDERTGVPPCYQNCVELCQTHADGEDPLFPGLTCCQTDHTKCKPHPSFGDSTYPMHYLVV